MMIPENAPVRLLNAQLEELEYGKLYEAYSSKGRKSAADPRMLFKVLVHGYLCGIYSSRKLEEACQYRIDFKWLLEDGKAPDHSTFARFRTGRCREAVEDLFYQFVRKLEEVGETDHKTVFIDGTKLESRAGRYSFVWRKNVEKQLARVKEKLKSMTGLSTCAAVRSMLEEGAFALLKNDFGFREGIYARQRAGARFCGQPVYGDRSADYRQCISPGGHCPHLGGGPGAGAGGDAQGLFHNDGTGR